jgi:GntR family transcriptional regulator/MocR family aminotransferase
MEPLFQFPVTLPPRGSRALLRALHGQLRAAILDGRLQADLQLPSTRQLALTLGISRNTAVAVYDLLLSEGYVVARRGAGSFVAATLGPRAIERMPVAAALADRRLAAFWRCSPEPVSSLPRKAFRHDFSVGVPDIAQLPFDVWRRLSARALRALSKAAPAYEIPQGRLALREAITAHASFARAVACRADDIVVTSGAQQAFDLLARVLVTPGHTVVAVEEPGYPPLRRAFEAAGARVSAVAVDHEGLRVDCLPAAARVIYVTPSHQFPLGVVMSPQRRAALLEFARARHAVVIEDDYDSEFRYGNRPLDALQTLDRNESVCYVGTFSKCLFPALRLGYVVAPRWLRPALARAKQLGDWHGDVLAQDTLAMFIAEGHLARHVRRMRKVYAQRRVALLAALARHGGGRLLPLPADAGLHLAVQLPRAVHAGRLVARAAAEGIRLEALQDYASARPFPNGLAFGFGLQDVAGIDAAVRRIARLLDG